MKKLIIGLVFLAALVFGSSLFAQQISPENSSDYYYVNVKIEKIYPSKLGYIIQYRKGANEMGRVAIPNEWFTFAGSKAELIKLPHGPNWPSLTVYYKEGEFSHVRLYIHWSKAHTTWGNVPQNVDVSEYFKDTENINIEY
ncbi:hypothetical protein AGMMS50293_08360 [Spirochaetia bacterium]|nr:hypothetical protein AGMMS50293_08360 [Spirochaetia bacterium]